jgi:hypothetical protein
VKPVIAVQSIAFQTNKLIYSGKSIQTAIKKNVRNNYVDGQKYDAFVRKPSLSGTLMENMPVS